MPNKVKFFVWRVASDVLPVRRRLCDRQVPISDECPCCPDGVESTLHLLRDCPFARLVWDTAPVPVNMGMNALTAEDWLLQLQVSRMLNEKDWAEFVTICWNVWYARNRRVWHGEILTAQEILRKSHSYCRQFWKLMERKKQVERQPRPPRVRRWKPPPTGQLKLNVDASVFKDSRHTGMGAVVRDSTGTVRYAKSAFFPGVVSSLEAELRALYHALKWLRSLRLQDVEVEADSKMMVELVQKHAISRRDEIGVLARSCKAILSQLQNTNLQFIRREGNTVAHHLARLSRTFGGDQVWNGMTPVHVMEQVTTDSRS